MEYKCALCDKTLIDPKLSTPGTFANEFNNKYYCSECLEAVQFADMVSQPKKIIDVEKKTKTSENLNTNKTISINSYKCVNCKNESSGNNCIHCGTPSPLMRSKKKNRKF